MPQRYLRINDRYDYKRTDWKDTAYEKINANFEELFAAADDGSGPAAVAAHEALGDPHAQYLTQAEGEALFDLAGASSTEMAAHLLASDPHPGYLTPAEASSLFASAAAPAAAVASHEGLPDPHPQYLVVAEGDARYQGADPTLGALSGLDGTAGILEQTGPETFTKRALGVGGAGSIPTRADADARYDPLGAAQAAQEASQEASPRLSAIAGMSTPGYLYFDGTNIVPAAGGGGGGNSWYPSGW